MYRSRSRYRIALMRLFRLFALAVGLGGGAILTHVATRRPSNHRSWSIDHARMPQVTVADSVVHIAGVRAFRYRGPTGWEPAWQAGTYDLRRLVSAWFVLAPFSTGWRGPAHGFVSFGFDDSTFVAISIEARREEGEAYGLVRGMGRNFELIYVIGTESDLIGRRALEASDVYLYPISTTPERARAVFLDMVERAERLRVAPEFYHTLANNCTSNLVRHVNHVVPGRIPGSFRLMFPGYADAVARGLGLIDGTLSIDRARARYRVNDRARDHLGDPTFSLRIRS